MNNGTIITQIGNKQHLFKDRESYPKEALNYIENIIIYNSSELSKDGVNGRIRFNDFDGNMSLQLILSNGVSKISDEDKVIVIIRGEKGNIWSRAYYGVSSEVDFVSQKEVYSLGSVEGYINSLKNFYNSWKVNKGSLGAVVVVLDKLDIFSRVIKDDFFRECYVLYSE